MSAEQMKNDPKSEYNPQEWYRSVDGYSKYGDVQFYKVERDETYGYDRFYVVYTLHEGLRLLNEFGYGGSLTSHGFTRVTIEDTIIDFSTPNEPVLTRLPEGVYSIEKMGFYDINGDGSEQRISNNPQGRRWMADRSQLDGTIFTNKL
jgi:hypothetical protein